MPSFLKQARKIVNRFAVKSLKNFDGQTRGIMLSQVMGFRGREAGSIADVSSVVYTIRNKDLVFTAEPTPATYERFLSNAQEQPGGVLFRNEAPAWFEYHEIEKEEVFVRPTGASGNTLRPPLGSKRRKFFENSFSYLVRNAQAIANNGLN